MLLLLDNNKAKCCHTFLAYYKCYFNKLQKYTFLNNADFAIMNVYYCCYFIIIV